MVFIVLFNTTTLPFYQSSLRLIVGILSLVGISHLKKKKSVACIFFDLRKAFDSIPHQALLKTLRAFFLLVCRA